MVSVEEVKIKQPSLIWIGNTVVSNNMISYDQRASDTLIGYLPIFQMLTKTSL